ncbi:MAG: putative outer membrane repeat protein [Myxococcota bacterium]|jgi:predicted outer membrane repeat protein
MHRQFPFILALLSLGCQVDGVHPDGSEAFETDAGDSLAPPPTLTLSSLDDAVPGRTTVFDVEGAEPFGTVHLAVGPGGLGDGICLPGGCLDVVGAFRAASAPVDDRGHATLLLTIPVDLEVGLEFGLQAVQIDAGLAVSEASLWTVRPVEIDPDADLDGDGVRHADDCDDDDPEVYPGAPEVCDGKDSDCDPTTSESGRIFVDRIGEYLSLTDAVAAVPEGGLVELCDGRFTVPARVRVDRAFTLQGAGIGVTVIDGEGEEIFEGEDADGFTLRDMTLENGDARYSGGAIFAMCRFCDVGLVVEDVEFRGNTAEKGGAVFMNSPATFRRVVFADNGALETGGAIHMESTNHDMLLEDCTFTDNTADDGGAVHLKNGHLTVLRSTFHRNSASGFGGALHLSSWGIWTAAIEDSDFGFGFEQENAPEDIRGNGDVWNLGVDADLMCDYSDDPFCE